jgi:hypothetical protein
MISMTTVTLKSVSIIFLILYIFHHINALWAHVLQHLNLINQTLKNTTRNLKKKKEEEEEE